MTRFAFSFFLITLCKPAISQINVGRYSYTNGKITLSFNDKGSGEWFRVNIHGADPEYDGPLGWYQFQTTNCNYSFNEPSSELVLSKYDCKNGEPEAEYTLWIK
jgi:hypothetical protein